MVEPSIYATVKRAGFSAEKPIVVDSELRVERGEAAMLVGPSGSGKTVFLLAITGVLKHFFNGYVEGSVKLAGLNPLAYSDYTKLPSKLGFVMQDPERQILYPTPLDEAVAVLEARGFTYEEAHRRALEVLKLLGLFSKLEEHVENLSGGEKKRLAIALSLVHDPEVLILDEPSASLDTEGIAFVKKLVREAVEKEHAVLLTEHKWRYFTDVASKAYVLVKHRVIPSTLDELASTERKPECKDSTLSSGSIVLETRNLSVGYKGIALVRNVDIYLRQGEVVALVGPNGSGKTTILKTISGFLKPIEGEVVLKSSVFYAPQNPDVAFVHGSVEKELKNTARKTQVSFEDLSSMYPWFQSTRNLHPLRLSHGQRRWLSLLIAYAYGKGVLLLDEPTTGLDYALYNSLVKLVAKLKSEKRAVLVSTHDPRFIADVADRVYVVKDARVFEEDKCRVVESMYSEVGL